MKKLKADCRCYQAEWSKIVDYTNKLCKNCADKMIKTKLGHKLTVANCLNMKLKWPILVNKLKD